MKTFEEIRDECVRCQPEHITLGVHYVFEAAENRIAALEEAANTSICIFCGTKVEKDLTVMLEHAKECEKRPENELVRRIEGLQFINNNWKQRNAELEAELAEAYEVISHFQQGAERGTK